jgi:hypothetical protein
VNVVAPFEVNTPVLGWLVDAPELWGEKLVPLLECGVNVVPPPPLELPLLLDDEPGV